MELESFKDTLRELIVDNEFVRIFKILKETLRKDQSKYDEMVVINGAYNRGFTHKIGNSQSSDQVEQNHNQISLNLATFIRSLEGRHLQKIPKGVLEESGSYGEFINEPILAFTSEQGVKSLELFFDEVRFSNVLVKTYEDDDYDASKFRIVVYDNQDLPVCRSEYEVDELDPVIAATIRERLNLMNTAIADGTKVLIHFGDILFWVNQHRDVVNSANSKFSLYARIKEVADYLNVSRPILNQ
ncbi:MAG: hypothetical protein AAFW73_22515 [Bacteroidota bacterium]